MARFSRNFQVAIDFLESVITGFWPVMDARSLAAASVFFASTVASPTPMLMTILSSRGTAKAFL